MNRISGESSVPDTFARASLDCRHCGMRVLFSSEGICPSCRISGNAPVTEVDQARIEQIRASVRPVHSAKPEDMPPGLPSMAAGCGVGIVMAGILLFFLFLALLCVNPFLFSS